MTNKTFKHFSFGTDLVVVGTNPEMADYSNPRGEIIGFTSYVQVNNEYGDTRVLTVSTSRCESEVLEAAEKLCKAFEARLANFGKLPVGFDRWVEGRALYGSDAYMDYGQDDDLQFERDKREDECFA